MQSEYRKFRAVLLHTSVATLCCLAVGFIFYQFDVFNIYHPALSFLVLGLTGSLFFFTLRELGWRTAWALLFAALVAHTGLLTRALEHGTLMRDIGTFAGLALAVALFYYKFYRGHDPKRLVNPLLLGGLWASTNLVFMALVGVIRGYFINTPFLSVPWGLLPMVQYGFLVGLGVGIGILVAEHLEPRLRLLLRKRP